MVAAPVFRHQAAIGQLLLHPIRHGVRLVDLVDRDDDRNFGGVGVVDGFEGLRHDAVIGRHDQHDDVRGLRSARTHAGEGFVTRRVQEHDLAAICGGIFVHNRDFVRTDVLGDAAGFAAATLVRRMESSSVVLP